MIHIIREGEKLEHIAEIYGVSTEDIIRSNLPDSVFEENFACFVPTDREVLFTDRACSTSALAKTLDTDEEILCRENNIPLGADIPQNSRIFLPKDEKYLRGIFSALYKVSDLNSSFINLDLNADMIDGAYIDCYDVSEGKINLPFDYPAINACKVNGVKSCLYIDDVIMFSEEDVILQLLHDLSFKEYSSTLLNIKDERELEYAADMISAFIREGMDVGIVGNEDVLKAVDSDIFSVMYYKAKRNIFDFGSFTEVIDSLVKEIPVEKLGYYTWLYCADINKDDLLIEYPSYNELCLRLKEQRCKAVSYDDVSRLCFYRYEAGGYVHNIIFEDLRSLYAKSAYLKDKGINMFLLPDLKRGNMGLCAAVMEGYDR